MSKWKDLSGTDLSGGFADWCAPPRSRIEGRRHHLAPGFQRHRCRGRRVSYRLGLYTGWSFVDRGEGRSIVGLSEWRAVADPGAGSDGADDLHQQRARAPGRRGRSGVCSHALRVSLLYRPTINHRGRRLVRQSRVALRLVRRQCPQQRACPGRQHPFAEWFSQRRRPAFRQRRLLVHQRRRRRVRLCRSYQLRRLERCRARSACPRRQGAAHHLDR